MAEQKGFTCHQCKKKTVVSVEFFTQNGRYCMLCIEKAKELIAQANEVVGKVYKVEVGPRAKGTIRKRLLKDMHKKRKVKEWLF